MGLLIAFIAGAASASVLILFVIRRSRGDDDALLGGLREELAKLDGTQRTLSEGLATRMQTLGEHQDTVLRQTGQLSEALRRPGVRGQWGQLTLSNVVEAAGLAEHVDFDTEVHLPGEDGAARPDLVVNLPGDGHVPVDSKVALDAYLDAVQTEDPVEQQRFLDLHVKHVRDKVRDLASKEYWARFRRSPEMVVMFIPSEAAFAAAAQHDATLIEDAARSRVIIATPATMLALLQMVALGWREAALSEHAERIRELGVELVGRLSVVGGHLARQGKALEQAVQAHNQAIGSYESRLLVTARKMGELGVQGADRLVEPSGVASTVRERSVSLAAPELAGGAAGAARAAEAVEHELDADAGLHD
jgi:DNA recombination protein RmuC